jgi:hypothetical protein
LNEKHKYQLQRWKLLIEDRIKSGMLIKDWCRQNGISETQYYYWLSRVRAECYEVAVQTLPAELALTQSSFVEIKRPDTLQSEEKQQTVDNCPTAVISIGGIRVEIFPNTTVTFMKRLIEALQYAQA